MPTPAQFQGLFSLQGKVAIITGASRGIGEAISHAMSAHGATVVLCARKQEGLTRVADAINAAGGTALAVAAHTGKPEMLANLMDTTIKTFGKVDILVNNAGANPYFGPIIHTEDAAFAKTFEVNLKGYFDMARLVANHLMARNAPGSIINVSSVLGMGAAPMQGVYGMTKAAVLSMTQTMALELGSTGIRVNAIAPGLIQTAFAAALTTNEEISARVLARTPLGRFGDPSEVAGAAVYLASDAARYVTGHTLVVDGGLTLGGF